MELSNLVTAFCVAASFMLVSCDVQETLQPYGKQPQLSLPRKVKLREVVDVKSSAYKDIMLQKKLFEDKKIAKEDVMARKRGTWREWVESPNKSEYFTMDYSWVRRRRPIHNNQMP
ncbi:hypothetical protein AAHA92_12200 [Salvia divinorum]|uniref:Uncharacterized protein n=1 Tax=Salvia divinorum TaxID=28513 RepID=A0ABD1HK93_SALDI